MKPKAWNHQDDLKAGVGRPIYIVHRDGTKAWGDLAAADQFTLKLIHDAPEGKSAVTYFKHDLAAYSFDLRPTA